MPFRFQKRYVIIFYVFLYILFRCCRNIFSVRSIIKNGVRLINWFSHNFNFSYA